MPQFGHDWRLCGHMEGHFIGTKYLCSLMRFMEVGILYHSPIIASPNTKVSLFPYFMNVIAMFLLTSQSHGRLIETQATEPIPVFLIQWDQHPRCCSLVTTYLSAINPLYWQLFKGEPSSEASFLFSVSPLGSLWCKPAKTLQAGEWAASVFVTRRQ